MSTKYAYFGSTNMILYSSAMEGPKFKKKKNENPERHFQTQKKKKF